jgi:glycosyltransferase involved in cell wall biosynthesis
MHIIHFTPWAPKRSGMFESVKDQIKYERRAGLKSDLVDPLKEDGGKEYNLLDDGWFSPIPWDDAKAADVWVMHYKIPDKLKDLFDQKVTIAVLHGPSEHCLMKEWTSEMQNRSFNSHIECLWKYDATVVINQHEFDIMELYDEKRRLHYIPNSIDLERVPQEGVTWEYQHRPAIASFDVSRLEKLPVHLLWASPRIVKKIPSGRVNIFGLPIPQFSFYRDLICKKWKREFESDLFVELFILEHMNLFPFMRGADIVFNNNFSGIASRVSMEAMAMGTPVVSYGGEYTKYHAKIFDLDSIAEQIERCWKEMSKKGNTVRKDTLTYAKQNFDRAKYIPQYVELYEKTLKEKKDG